MTTTIKQISATKVWPIRHEVMWPNQPFSFIQLPNDKQGLHFGLFAEEELITVVSLFINKNDCQFRKFATLVNYQGKGHGSKLLSYIIDITQKKGLAKIWCNARIEKAKYYEKFGLAKTNKQFLKKGIQYVVMERYF